MNSLERVMAVMEGREPDKTPLSLTLSLFGAKLAHKEIIDYYTKPDCYLEGQKRVIDQGISDVIFSPFVAAAQAQAFGSVITNLEKNPPIVKKPAFSRKDLNNIKLPNLSAHKSLSYLVESTNILAKLCKRDHPIAASVCSPIDLPSLLFGIGEWMEILLFHKSQRDHILQLMEEHYVSLANTLLDMGATFIVTPFMFTSPRLIPETMVIEFIIPYLKSVLSKIKGPVVFHHGGNLILPYLKHYKDLPSVVAFIFDPRDDISLAQEVLGEKILLMGNLDGPNLWRYDDKQMKVIAGNLLKKTGSIKKYIPSSSHADIAYDTNLEVLKTLARTIAQGYEEA